MPYTSPSELPENVRNNLPLAAQRIFVKSFNSAHAKLKPGEDEVIAFKIAWTAVKKQYEKRAGLWCRRVA